MLWTFPGRRDSRGLKAETCADHKVESGQCDNEFTIVITFIVDIREPGIDAFFYMTGSRGLLGPFGPLNCRLSHSSLLVSPGTSLCLGFWLLALFSILCIVSFASPLQLTPLVQIILHLLQMSHSNFCPSGVQQLAERLLPHHGVWRAVLIEVGERGLWF